MRWFRGLLLLGWLVGLGAAVRTQPVSIRPDALLSQLAIRELSHDRAGFTWVGAIR